MVIQHNITAMNSYRNLNNNQNAIAGNLEKLSSGYQINRAGDNAAGLAISEKMRSQITGLDAAQANVADGISLVKTAEGALQEVHDMLNRMTELATLSANGTFDDDVDRAALQSELEQLFEEIDRIADSTNFNGITLLDGTWGTAGAEGTIGTGGGLQLQIGDTSDSFNQLKVTINSCKTSALAIGSNGGTTGKKISVGSQTGAVDAIGRIKSAINSISTIRANLGAIQNRLEHTANNLSVMEENIQDAESTIRDTDVAAEMMEYTKNNILIQSAQSMLAQANQLPQGVLQLLG